MGKIWITEMVAMMLPQYEVGWTVPWGMRQKDKRECLVWSNYVSINTLELDSQEVRSQPHLWDNNGCYLK